jgi:beta-glucanase (GH16 family)
MSTIPQHGRGFVPDVREAGLAGFSVVVFLVTLMLGVYLSELSSTSPQATPPAEPPVDANGKPPLGRHWTLVTSASTDFTGTAVDQSVWDLYDSVGNAGVGWRRPHTITVEDNLLRIKATGEVSGGLSQKFGQTYGRWVIRARMEAGAGYGPAILLWPDSEKWPEDGEIDIVELPKGDRKEVIMTTHWGEDNSQISKGVKGDFTQWHTFMIDWLPDRLVFSIDGEEKWRVTNPDAIPRKPMHLAIQNDVGACDSWIGCRNKSTPENVSLWVSSVRVYSPS